MNRQSGYITKVKANVSIYATKKTSNVLDGTYQSMFMGRSMNFEDLREYVPGDNIKDIDWKASSRSGSLLVKRYIADKKHNIMLLFDSGFKMTGDTESGAQKKEIALMTAGTIAYLAYKNGDMIGSIYNIDGMIKYYPFRTGLLNAEKILAAYHADIEKGKKSDLPKSLDYIINHFKRRMIIFVITDIKGISEVKEAALRRLMLLHDVLFINIGDADLTGTNSYDLDTGRYVPSFISGNKRLAKLEKQHKQELRESNSRKLVKNGVMTVDINDEAEILVKTIELLDKHKYAHIR